VRVVYRRKLLVLDKAHELLLAVNRAAPGIRKAHLRPLKTQLIKSALSIGSCVSEGRTKESEREFLRFLQMALGSAGELQYQLRAAGDAVALSREVADQLAAQAEEVAKMLHGLIRRIREDLGDDPDA
jgi:four helix bundle protein